MCGIVGAFNFGNSAFRVGAAYIEKMRDTMTHRGPDGAGAWIAPDGQIGLGHRRLAIIDLSIASNQPMSNADGSLQVVFNGEIYNHAELRTQLERGGKYHWKTHHSDTEVILHAFEEWGIECIHKFRGMFAIGLWDATKRELWLIRDRLGIKPLYYSIHDGRIVFASEIKALLKDPDQKRSVDERAFYHYLSFLAAPAPSTLFEGINKLPNGTWLRITQDGTIEETRYWDVLDHLESITAATDEIVERVRAELRSAVKLHKVSDVPVGVFLSGGIDSSLNAALLSEGERDTVKTFTIGYEGHYETVGSELHYARRMAVEAGTKHHEQLLTVDDLIKCLPRMIRLQDEPIADLACVPVYYLSALARNNDVIVCLVGEGADEFFCGYPRWKSMLRFQKLAGILPTFLKRLGLVMLRLAARERSSRFEWLKRDVAGRPMFWGGAEAFTDSQKHRLLSRRLKAKFSGSSSWAALEPIWDRFQQKTKGRGTQLHWMSYLDMNFRLPELLLMRVDKMTMGSSLEARVPFLDHEFVELAVSLPESLHTKNGSLKYILKRAARGLIPDELIDRRKQGLGVPIYEWFSGALGETMRVELEEFCSKTDLLDRDEVMSLIDQGRGPEDLVLLNLALWWKEYILPGDFAEFAIDDSVEAAV